MPSGPFETPPVDEESWTSLAARTLRPRAGEGDADADGWGPADGTVLGENQQEDQDSGRARPQSRRERLAAREAERAAAEPRRPRRAPRGRRDDPPRRTPALALRAIDGHITRTDRQATAWYRLADQAWSFRSNEARNGLIARIASQLGELTGKWVHVRVTSRPYSIAAWAQAFHHDATGRLPDLAEGVAPSWREFLRGEQLHLAAMRVADKQVFVGVEVSGRNAVDRWADALGRFWPSAQNTELVALAAEIGHIDAIMGQPGLEAVPATAADMAWLMRRSVGLGLPAPSRMPPVASDRWESEDLATFTDNTAMYCEPYDATLRVRGLVDEAPVERELAILTVGQVGPLHIPERSEPWMHRTDELPFPVEWSARFLMREPNQVTGELARQAGKVRSQERHYTDDHDQDPPLALQRQRAQVSEIEDQLSGGLHGMNTRLYGWWRIAVSGEDRDQVIDRARAVIETFKPDIEITHPEGQYALAREFIPGEQVASSGYRRRGSALWAAAGVPAVNPSVGDEAGILLGHTSGASRRPVTWHPWLSQERLAGSGLSAVVGGLGAGKSYLTGAIVYKSLRAGARWTVLDPSGPLAELTKLPELAPFSRHIHLLAAEPGILNPYRVISDPRPEHFVDELDPQRAWRRALQESRGLRQTLVTEALTGLLPHVQAREPATGYVLLRAIAAVGLEAEHDLGEVIAVLHHYADHYPDEQDEAAHARRVADFLDNRRRQPQAALLFPDPDHPVDPWADDGNVRLTVLTMQGLTLPNPTAPREAWSEGEALAVQLLNLASWLTQRTIYDAARDQRKGVALDEAHALSQTASGKDLIGRLSRDSRKHNARSLFASQLAGDLLRIPGFASLVDAVFVGRTDDLEAQTEALQLLKIPDNMGYQRVLGTLSPRPRRGDRDRVPRQFVFSDGHGGVEQITIDLDGDHLAALRSALDTNPNAHRSGARELLPADDDAYPELGTGHAVGSGEPAGAAGLDAGNSDAATGPIPVAALDDDSGVDPARSGGVDPAAAAQDMDGELARLRRQFDPERQHAALEVE